MEIPTTSLDLTLKSSLEKSNSPDILSSLPLFQNLDKTFNAVMIIGRNILANMGFNGTIKFDFE